MSRVFQDYIAKHNQAVEKLSELADGIHQVGELLIKTLRAGNKILVMGNGGSAADAQHMVAELVGRFEVERHGLPAVALTTDTSILTAVSNDFGFESLFSRQVEALAQKGDAVVGISTSGNSQNVITAIDKAKEKDCLTVGLLGRDGGKLAGKVDYPLTVGVDTTPHIQEAHVVIIHLLCQLIDQSFSGSM